MWRQPGSLKLLKYLVQIKPPSSLTTILFSKARLFEENLPLSKPVKTPNRPHQILIEMIVPLLIICAGFAETV
jgi:hypothetical protein